MFAIAQRAKTPTSIGHVRHQVTPHTTDRATLDRQAAVYRQHSTPMVGPDGTVTASASPPGTARLAGKHLGEIQQTFGDRGLDTSIAGLTITRGHSFASVAVHHAPASVQTRVAARADPSLDENGQRSAAAAHTSPASLPRDTGTDGVSDTAAEAAGQAIANAGPGVPIPEPARARLSSLARAPLDDVRVHDDSHSHAAATLLSARAVTLGRSIYLGEGEYQPHSADGFKILAHEVAHAVQQHGSSDASLSRKLEVGASGSAHEQEADRFADAAARGDLTTPPLSAGSVAATRAMRVIGFTGRATAPRRVNPTAAEDAAGTNLQIAAGTPPGPYFDWDGAYTITGDAGDPFANFAIFPVQVTRSVWENVAWGTGADQTTRRLRIATPARDSTAGSDHYDDPSGSATFGAAGDVRASNLNDTPGTPAAITPFANPVPPRGGTRGWFNWGMSFVAYLGARDATVAGAAGFRALNFCYWNLSVDGNWDTARPLGGRVNANGQTNLGPVSDGVAGDFPPMFGGTTTNARINDPGAVTLT